MTHGVMVALLILVQSVKVRILMGQRKLQVMNFSPAFSGTFLFLYLIFFLTFLYKPQDYEIDNCFYFPSFNRKSFFPGLLQLLFPAKQ